MSAGITTSDVGSRPKVIDRIIRRWQKKLEFNAEMTWLNNNRSMLISKLLDQLSIASFNWVLNYFNDISRNAIAKVKWFKA